MTVFAFFRIRDLNWSRTMSGEHSEPSALLTTYGDQIPIVFRSNREISSFSCRRTPRQNSCFASNFKFQWKKEEDLHVIIRQQPEENKFFFSRSCSLQLNIHTPHFVPIVVLLGCH